MFVRALTATLLLCGVTACSEAPAAPSSVRPHVDVRAFALPNGLVVVLGPDAGARGVAVRVRYYAGAKDDPDGKAGVAHVVGHMMFGGTPRTDGRTFHASLEDVGGGRANSVVTPDATDYFEEMPTGAVDYALWLEADRMAHGAASFDDERLARERDVVKIERVERSQRDEDRTALDLAAAQVFGSGHPYGREREDARSLDAITLADVRAFVERHYHPSHAALVVCGRFDADAVRDAVHRNFMSIPAGPPPVHRTFPTPRLAASGPARIETSSEASKVVLAWPIPAIGADGAVEMPFVQALLEGQLDAALVRRGRLATRVAVHREQGHLGGLLVVVAELRRGVPHARVASAIVATVRMTANAGRTIEWEGFEPARDSLAASLVLQMWHPAARARAIQGDVEYDGSPNALDASLDRIERVHAADVGSAVQQFLVEAPHATIEVHGDDAHAEAR